MSENKHNKGDLEQMQALPLEIKIKMTQRRIREWYEAWDGQVAVSFSGGKDSTVLLDIVRNRCGYKDVPAVFADTGLEYPEIREFVKGFENVEWLKPEMNFKKIIETYGYPFISKEVSKRVHDINTYIKNGGAKEKCYAWELFNNQACVPGTDRLNPFNIPKWKFLIEEPVIYKFSHRCCDEMKKKPMHKYSKRTGRVNITAQMACESRLRTQKWMQNGCNAFEIKNPISNPMAFWTEQDVLQYIKKYNIPICSVYGDIVEDISGTEEVEGQLTISDLEGYEGIRQFDAEKPKLKTTGCNRTGCMFCGFGCHLEKPGDGRFEKMKQTHPKTYEWIMKPMEEGGLGYKKLIDWLNEKGNLNIKY